MAVMVPILLIVGLFGAVIGSFISMVTYRLPRDERIGMSRSRCPACGTSLTVRDLFPVLSWVASRGKCRHCKTSISVRYPLTELACALGAIGAVLFAGLTWEAAMLAGLWWCIVAMIVTDLEFQIILDEVQIAVGVFGVGYGIATGVAASDMITGAVVGLLTGLALKYGFLYLRNKDGLGMGDVKFLFVAGIWLASGANFVPFLFFSGIMGVISGIAWQAMGRGDHFPFGPALAFALLLCVIFPNTANGFWTLYGLLTH